MLPIVPLYSRTAAGEMLLAEFLNHRGLNQKEPFKKRKRGIMDPDKIVVGLSKEIISTLKAMSKAKNINEKEVHSRIVKNLCESLGVFFDLVNEMMPVDFDGDSDKDDIPF